MKPTPEHIDPVAWVRESFIEELHKDGMHSGITTALWLDESDAGKRHPKRVPLYDATAIAAAEERGRLAERDRCYTRPAGIRGLALLSEVQDFVSNWWATEDGNIAMSPTEAAEYIEKHFAHGTKCRHCKGKGYQSGDPEGALIENCDYCGGSGEGTAIGAMKLFGHWSKHRLADGVFLPLVCYVPEGPDYTTVPLYAITKEPTP